MVETSPPSPSPSRLTWPQFGRWSICALLVLLCGPGFVQTFQPALAPPRDFFQDWAAARNWTNGLPVYGNLREAAGRYLHLDLQGAQLDGMVEVNGHPPTALWPALPLAGLSFTTAFLIWDLASLALVVVSLVLICRELGYRTNLATLSTAVSLALLCNPLWQLLSQGQFGGLLLFLLTAAWAADRRGNVITAGICIGLAVALKLYPGLIVGYWLLCGRHKQAACAIVAFLIVAGMTAFVLRSEAFVTYVREVLPGMQSWYGSGLNLSLTGFWHRLFHEPGSVFAPLVADGSIAKLGTALSSLAVLGVWVAIVLRSRKTTTSDGAWMTTIVAMTLVSPLTWDHHLVVLALPLAWAWRETAGRRAARIALTIILAAVWISPVVVWRLYLGERFGRTILSPGESLTLFSFQCYAMVALFVVTARSAWRTCETSPVRHGATMAEPSLGGVPSYT